MEEKVFQQLSIRFWAKPEEDVCLILCEPSLVEVMELLSGLSTLCPDAPSDLATLAVNSLQFWQVVSPTLANHSASPPSPPPPPPSELWYLEQKPLLPQTDGSPQMTEQPQLCDEVHQAVDQDPVAVEAQPIEARAKPSRSSRRHKAQAVEVADVSVNDNSPRPSNNSTCSNREDLLNRFAFRRKLAQKGMRGFSCSLCKRGDLTELMLRQHLQREHRYRPCKHCRKIFPSDEALSEHVCPVQNITCDKCPKFFRSVAGWLLHHKKVHEGLTRVCDICGDQLSDVNALRRHNITRHPTTSEPTVPPCHICGKQLRNRVALMNHEKRFHNESFRSGPCHYCHRIFSSGFALRRHLSTVHRADTRGGVGDVGLNGSKMAADVQEEEEHKILGLQR